MKKILVIEDERSIREPIIDLLNAEGFYTVGAENGSLGLQQAQEFLPDLILCDVVMPQLDGYQVLAALRRNPLTAGIPLIFLTAMGAKHNVRQGMELGADDYLAKPCTAVELLKAVNSRFEKQAILANQSRQKLDDLRSSIALSLPHELRTPLHGILGLSELLMDDYANIERQEILELAQGIHGAAKRLHRLTQNFLMYAELELASRDPEWIQSLRENKTFYSDLLITGIATQIAQRANRTADLHLELANSSVMISDLKLSKVMEELIDNAFKFSKADTPVHLTSVVIGDRLILSITDQGRGITPEQIADMGAYMQFDRKFYEQQGTGLGLIIARRIVELQGGELTIASTPEVQTKVQVSLPVDELEPNTE